MAELKRESGVSKALNAAWVRPFLFLLFIVVMWDVTIRLFQIPAYQIPAPGDVVAVRETSRKSPAILHALEEVKGRGVPEWLQFDAAGFSAKIGSVPTREQINLPVQEQLIVELYSK